MKIAIACDHGGFELKETIAEFLAALGHEVKDFGCYEKKSIDYPDFIFPAAEAVANGSCERGVVICTTGIGVSVCANKVKGVRCSLCTDEYTARMTREHNNANILALGANVTTPVRAKEITKIWMETEFSHAERHQRRIDKITKYENTH